MSVTGKCAKYYEPPRKVPNGDVDVSGGGRWRIWQYAGTKIDAPIMGNGSLLTAFSGPCRWPQFWITTNDFWQLESAANWEFFHDNAQAKHDPCVSLGSPRPIGRMVFDIPALQNAAYEVTQEFETATTTACYTLEDGKRVQLSSWVAAIENILIIEFLSEVDLDLSFDFYFPNELGKGCYEGVDFLGKGEGTEKLNGTFVGLVGGKPVQIKEKREGIVSGSRTFTDNTDMPVRAAFAGCFLNRRHYLIDDDRDDTRVTLEKGKRYYYVLPVRTWRNVTRPVEYALSRAKWITESEILDLREQHVAWWRDYFHTSEITLADSVMEQRYYLCQYMMGSLSGDLSYPPNILGISTTDRMAWNGNYKINYNHQSPYLGLMVAGHFRQSDPHDTPYLDLLDITKEMSQRLLGHEGSYFPLGLGPHGMVSEALLLYMKSPAVHGALNMIMRYELTLDRAYAGKVYPFLLSVARFWEKDLVYKEGFYHVVGDGMHERVTSNIEQEGMPWDPVNTLGYLRKFFSAMCRISEDLNLNANKRDTWMEISEKIAPYPIGTIREIESNPTLWKESDAKLCELLPEELLDRKVFYDEGVGGKWSFHFPGNVMHIYPGNAVSLGSDPELLEIARNTIHIHSVVEDALAAYEREQDEKALLAGCQERASRETIGESQELRKKDRHFYKAGAWNASNLSCLFFPAAVRVGYDPEKIWQELSDMIRHRGLPNGFLEQNPHGIENLSTVPNTIQEMMLQSHEGILRIFPVWPKSQPSAAFRGLWAYGAFVVDASYEEGQVSDVSMLCTKGGPLRVQNPWEQATVMRSGKNAFVIADEIIELETAPMERIQFRPIP